MEPQQPTNSGREEKMHFLDYWQVISKRKEVIIATFIIVVFATTVWSLVQKPVYSASAQVKVEPSVREFQPLDLGQGRVVYQFDPIDFMTHLQLMQCDQVLTKVITGDIHQKVWRCQNPVCGHLYGERERARIEEPVCQRCGDSLRSEKVLKYRNFEPLNRRWAERDKYERPEYNLQSAVGMLRRNLGLAQDRGTKLIRITYMSREPKEAEEVANMVAEAYMEFHEDKNREIVRRALSGLDSQIEKLSVKLHRERTNLGDLKDRYNLVIGREGFPETIDLSVLTTQLNQLKVQIAGRESQYSSYVALSPEHRQPLARVATAIRRLVSAAGDEEAAAREIEREFATMQDLIAMLQDYQSIFQLKDYLLQQKIALSQALEQLGPEHPGIRNTEKLIRDIKANLCKEARGVLQMMSVELQSLREQARKLEESIEESSQEILAKERLFREYSQKETEVAGIEAILQQFHNKRTVELSRLSIPSISIVQTEQAVEPLYPARPNRFLNIIIGVFVGLTVGTGLAYFIEYLDTSVKTIDDIERSLNLPILGVIPQKVRILTEESPKSPAYEAYRMLWTSIEFARQDSKIKTILITSGGVGEGKTTTLVNLGIAVAHNGPRVLLVDSDFRRPRIHKLLGFSNKVGLTDILLRNVGPDSVIVQTNVPNLWALPSGKLPSSAGGLLNSTRMRECVEFLYDRYDVIMFDSPPVLGVSDSSIMANLVDRVLLVIEYRRYPKSVAMRAKKVLESAGAKVLGGIINNLNVIKEDYYYYSQVYHYFQSPEEEADEAGEEQAQRAEGAVEDTTTTARADDDRPRATDDSPAKEEDERS